MSESKPMSATSSAPAGPTSPKTVDARYSTMAGLGSSPFVPSGPQTAPMNSLDAGSPKGAKYFEKK